MAAMWNRGVTRIQRANSIAINGQPNEAAIRPAITSPVLAKPHALVRSIHLRASASDCGFVSETCGAEPLLAVSAANLSRYQAM
jgi:hypothetical protein